MDIVIKQRVDEVGLYSLTCQLFFTSNEARLTQKKSYKFAVLSPFNISHRVYNFEESSGDRKTSFVEISLENISHQSVTLNYMKLEPTNTSQLPHLKCILEDVGSQDQDRDSLLIQSRCRLNKIFKLTLLEAEDCNRPETRNGEHLELALKVGWVSATYGEAWIDSYKVDLPIPDRRDKPDQEKNAVVLKADVPSVNKRQEEFKICLYLKNNLDTAQRGLSVRLDFDRLLPIIILGNDRLSLDEIKAGETVKLELDCQALVSGVYNLDGIYVFDDLKDKKVSMTFGRCSRPPNCCFVGLSARRHSRNSSCLKFTSHGKSCPGLFSTREISPHHLCRICDCSKSVHACKKAPESI